MRRTSGVLIRRFNLAVPSSQQQTAFEAVRCLEGTGGVQGGSLSAASPHGLSGKSSQSLEWLSLRSLATRSRLSLRGSKGLGTKRRQEQASRDKLRDVEEEASLAENYFASGASSRNKLRNFDKEESLASSYYSSHELERGARSKHFGSRVKGIQFEHDLYYEPPSAAGKMGRGRGSRQEVDDELVEASPGGWGSISGSRATGRKVPARDMDLESSTAEFYSGALNEAVPRQRGTVKTMSPPAGRAASREFPGGDSRGNSRFERVGEEAEYFGESSPSRYDVGGSVGKRRGTPTPPLSTVERPQTPGLDTSHGGKAEGPSTARRAAAWPVFTAPWEEEGAPPQSTASRAKTPPAVRAQWGEADQRSGMIISTLEQGATASAAGAAHTIPAYTQRLSRYNEQATVRDQKEGFKGSGRAAKQQQQQEELRTLTQLQQQANQATTPNQVLAVLRGAVSLLDLLHASTKPSPQQSKQVAGLLSVLHNVCLRVLPKQQQQAEAAASGLSTAKLGPQGPPLSEFNGFAVASFLRLLGKAGYVPPVALHEGLLNELLANDCLKLLTASRLAWVQVLQGIFSIRSKRADLQLQQAAQGQQELGQSAQQQQQQQQDSVDAWTPSAPEAGSSEVQHQPEVVSLAESHASQVAKISSLEQDLAEVIGSLLESTADTLEPDTAVMIGAYLARLEHKRKEVYEAVARIVATEKHRLTDMSGSQLGMLARSLANPGVMMHVPELLDQLAKLVEERKAVFVTSLGWPDLLFAYSKFQHPCPGLLSLLADSAERHMSVMPFSKLYSVAISVMLLDCKSASSLRILQAVCQALPQEHTGPAGTAQLLNALASSRYRDPCLQPLLSATSAAWLPPLTTLANVARNHAAKLSSWQARPVGSLGQGEAGAGVTADAAIGTAVKEGGAAATAAGPRPAEEVPNPAQAVELRDAVLKGAPPGAATIMAGAWKCLRPVGLLNLMEGSGFSQLFKPLSSLADAGMLTNIPGAYLAEANAMALASAHSSNAWPKKSNSSSSSSESNGSSEASASDLLTGDSLLSFVRCALRTPLRAKGKSKSFKDANQLDWLFETREFSEGPLSSKLKLAQWNLPTYRQLTAHALATVRALGLGGALQGSLPCQTGLQSCMQHWLSATCRPAAPDAAYVAALLGGHVPVQEVLYLLPSELEQGPESSVEGALSGEGWEVAEETMKSDGSGAVGLSQDTTEGAGEDVKVDGSEKLGLKQSTAVAEGAGVDSEQEAEDTSTGSGEEEGGGSSTSSDSDSGNDSDSDSSSGSERGSGAGEELDNRGSDGGSTWGTEAPASDDGVAVTGMAALRSLLLRAGTQQSDASYKTLLLASALSSVLLGQGADPSAMRHLLVADGRLVLAGAVHSSAWHGHTSPDSPSNGDGALNTSSSSNSSSGGATVGDQGIGHSNDNAVGGSRLQQYIPPPLSPNAPVAVLLVRPEDFCQQNPDQAGSGPSSALAKSAGLDSVSGRRAHKQQLLQPQPRVATGDLVLRRWLLRAAGVRVVEVDDTEWSQVMVHEAAASMLIADALEQQL